MAINPNITSSWNSGSLGLPFNFSDTYKKGIDLGMWGKSNLDPASPVKPFVVPEGVNPNDAYVLEKILPSVDPEQAWAIEKRRIDYIADLQEKQAERRQKFGEESTGKAVLYQALANIGPTIAQAVNPGYLMEGASRITAAANDAFRSVPSMNVQSPGYNVSQFKYF